jgi:hypothetical protein
VVPSQVSRELVVVPEAEAEIAEAAAWFEDKTAGRGQTFLRALEATLAAVERDPHQHPIVFADVRCAVLRGFPYAVMYVAFAEEIVVVA